MSDTNAATPAALIARADRRALGVCLTALNRISRGYVFAKLSDGQGGHWGRPAVYLTPQELRQIATKALTKARRLQAKAKSTKRATP